MTRDDYVWEGWKALITTSPYVRRQNNESGYTNDEPFVVAAFAQTVFVKPGTAIDLDNAEYLCLSVPDVGVHGGFKVQRIPWTRIADITFVSL